MKGDKDESTYQKSARALIPIRGENFWDDVDATAFRSGSIVQPDQRHVFHLSASSHCYYHAYHAHGACPCAWQNARIYHVLLALPACSLPLPAQVHGTSWQGWGAKRRTSIRAGVLDSVQRADRRLWGYGPRCS